MGVLALEELGLVASELSLKNERKCVFSNALWIEDLGDAEMEPEVMVMGRGNVNYREVSLAQAEGPE